MKLEEFNAFMTDLKKMGGVSIHGRFVDAMCYKYPSYPKDTVDAIVDLWYRNQTKRRTMRMKGIDVYQLYTDLAKEGDENACMTLAERYEYPPALVCKIVLEGYAQQLNKGPGGGITKPNLWKILENMEIDDKVAEETGKKQSQYSSKRLYNDTSLITDAILREDVISCCAKDDQYGPTACNYKRNLGLEYEKKLNNYVIELGVQYKTENELRSLGNIKTPDIHLDVPIKIGDKLVHWIESKALFSDLETHRKYVGQQYEPYYNLYGPGLVIYWFGYVEIINDEMNTKFIVMDSLPKKEDIIIDSLPKEEDVKIDSLPKKEDVKIN